MTRLRSKGKKSKKTVDWNLDGGSNSNTTAVINGPRRNRLADVKQRRESSKQLMRRFQVEEKKKMSNKLTFNQVVDAGCENVDQVNTPVKIHHPSTRNPLSLSQRLKKLLKSESERDNTNSNDTGDSSQPIDNTVVTNSSDCFEMCQVLSFEEEENMYQSTSRSSECDKLWKYFFSSDARLPVEKTVCRQPYAWDLLLRKMNTEGVFGYNNEAFPVSPIKSFSDIPGLSKNWLDTKYHLSLNQYDKMYLPNLCSYQDVFVEGRTHLNDNEIMRSMLMHMTVHIVRAR